MAFYFADKKGDPLMGKIRLRDISSRAKQWDHPMKGVFKSATVIQQLEGDIFKAPKKEREQFCTSLFALAFKADSGKDWWTNMPTEEPPDGLAMTFIEEKKGGYMGYLRELEIVEHRGISEDLFKVIRNKMTKYNYGSETVLVCLALSPDVYNLELLSKAINSVTSTLEHVFIVFSGVVAILDKNSSLPARVPKRYTMVQLKPVFQSVTFDIGPHMEDFKTRYNLGQESRLIEGDSIYFGTSNTSHKKQ